MDVLHRVDRIVLAHTPPFRLGSVIVHPATRQVVREDLSETLEPRIMQVLVALADAKGRPVTRDELISRCWDGQVVGENSIQRPISRLRNLAATLGAGSFRLETISKIGYRIVDISGSGPPPGEGSSTVSRGLPIRVAWIAVAGVVALCLAGAAAFWASGNKPSERLVIVVAGGASAKTLAADVAAELARAVRTHVTSLSVANAGAAPVAGYRVQINQEQFGNRVRVDAGLAASGDSELLWNAVFERPSNETAYLRLQIANELAGVLLCAFSPGSGSGAMDRETLGLLFSTCARRRADPDAATIEILRKIAIATPQTATAWGNLAFAEADLAQTLGTRESEILRTKARADLERSRALDRNAGIVFATEALLTEAQHWADQLARLERGIAVHPGFALLHDLRSRLLQRVGRMADSLESTRQAVALEPSSEAFEMQLIATLLYSGYVESARTELGTAEKIWPNSLFLRGIRFRMELRFGDPVQMMRDIDNGVVLPDTSMEFANGAVRAFLLARADPRLESIDRAVNQAKSIFRQEGSPTFLLQTLEQFNRIDEAYEVLGNPIVINSLRESGTDVLFRASMRTLRLDPRFMLAAEKLGLTQYWQSANAWPDFCRDPKLPYDCRTEVRRAQSSTPKSANGSGKPDNP